MFGKKEDIAAMQAMIRGAAKAQSGAQERCFRYLDESLLDEIPLRDEKGEIQTVKNEKGVKVPVMQPNSVLNRVTAFFKLAFHSKRFRHVNSNFLNVIMRAKKHVERMAAEGGPERDYYVKKLEGEIRIRIAIVCKELNININELSSMVPGMLDTALTSARDDEKDLGLF